MVYGGQRHFPHVYQITQNPFIGNRVLLPVREAGRHTVATSGVRSRSVNLEIPALGWRCILTAMAYLPTLACQRHQATL